MLVVVDVVVSHNQRIGCQVLYFRTTVCTTDGSITNSPKSVASTLSRLFLCRLDATPAGAIANWNHTFPVAKKNYDGRGDFSGATAGEYI